MTAYRVGDVPSHSDVFEVPAEILTTNFTSATGVLFAPDGSTVLLTGSTMVLGTASEEDAYGNIATVPVVTVAWGTVSPFAAAGLYELALTLNGAGTVQQSLPYFPVVVEAEDGWLTIDSIRRLWRDAPTDDEDVFELLQVSKGAVEAFAPVLVPDPVSGRTLVPANYRKAQRMQARNTWNAAKVDPSNGSLGEDTFVIRPVPLDWQVKQVLRPKPALPWVG